MGFPFIGLNNLEFLECIKLVFLTFILPPWVTAPLVSHPYTTVTISDVQN
jgi:hypothetical protein